MNLLIIYGIKMYRKLPNCLTPSTIIIVWNKILQKQKINNTYTTENQRLPCVSIFAMRFISRAEQRACLSCVFYMAHGKGLVCRASGKNARQTHDFVVRFFRICTANYFSLLPPTPNKWSIIISKNFVMRFLSNARQTYEFAPP
jgi:hypothetical protein